MSAHSQERTLPSRTEEGWVCDEDGSLPVCNESAEREASARVDSFPTWVDL